MRLLLPELHGDFNPLPPQGGRRVGDVRRTQIDDFNPLPPQGGRQPPKKEWSVLTVFQSTPSPRRETLRLLKLKRQQSDFNPLPPQGGRQDA